MSEERSRGRGLGKDPLRVFQGGPGIPETNLALSAAEILARQGLSLDETDTPRAGASSLHSSHQVQGGDHSSSVNERDPQQEQAVLHLELSMIDESPYQPRLVIDEETLSSLATTIESGGLNNPIVVRRKPNGRYEIIGGHRRRLAYMLLKRTHIPAIERILSDEDAAIMVMVDNDAREDITEFERGRGYRQLLDLNIFSSQAELARRVGKSYATVSRCLAYFNLPSPCIKMLEKEPGLVGNKVIRDFVAFAESGESDLVIAAFQKIKDSAASPDNEFISQFNALNWLKGEVRRKTRVAPSISISSLTVNGQHYADVKIDGRKLVLTPPKHIDPNQLLEAISKMLTSPEHDA